MSRRLKFFLSHLFISMCVGFAVIGLIFLVWYPAPLAKAVGVTHISLMLLTIDVILGPILGFIVFKEGKKTLKIDLTVIVILQLCALSYGLFNIYQGKPAWLVFQNDHFDLIRLNDALVTKNIQKENGMNPQFKAVDMGKTPVEKNKYLVEEMQTGIPASYRVERYTPIEKSAVQLLKEKRNLQVLKAFNEQDQIDKVVERYSDAVGWLPLRVLTGIDMVVLIDKHGAVLGIADLRPWKLS
ncbi:TfpX/TfpZ family type IV pilin accessory protein [Acinetobacter pragensis]|uniref:TfpX/TfpZ family type IV pilin accessory protein n=1 Tax=Acinetobacter pragensis TaxID=1806892 RepID=UPI00334067E5